MITRRTQCVSAIVVLLLFSSVQCHNNFTDLIAQLYTQVFYNQLSNITFPLLRNDITDTASFCIRDPVFDWDQTFNFSSNLTFLTSCALKSNADIFRLVCTPAEVKLYFMSLFKRESESTNYLKLNKNCNRTSWFASCEPGWACSAGSNVEFGRSYSKDIPARTLDCQACCEGFFCPQGFACMIPCPLGSYCPLATLNKTTGICEPYRYQLPPGRPNHTCGGADIWADVGSSSEVFCSAGSYCPSNIQKTSCSSGHYCRMGSISEKRCFKLSSCDPNTANQNIHAYGIILIAALSTLLLTIYNCSDRVLTIREMRNAKARKAAARSVTEKAQARDKYKSAKNAAKKPKIASPSQLSPASCKKTVIHPLALESLGQTKAETDDDLDSSLYISALNSPEQSSHAVEDDPDSCNGFSLELGDKNVDRKMKNEKQIRTHSEIFQYAYAQLEKEKALLHLQQNKNLTFSGLISMATSQEIRKRPMIEVSFRDLSLTLKGKNKRLLRCVTGKIMPGHITAVMGTSGAGKTTLISALAGKTVGCKMTGLILINGKPESIHSYRKIIGFVPQDDIVHGNLTVEENLWFSARCRLSADLSKPDKVLIVERVIESLGLQAVRDSLVGTVEKRRISGGERKRVNVGLELVMEPSLLILDEPTSGLDSSTSQLLLRALRREALEGVNICMVVHQPSYTLFKMFDDLILLKGGLTVYHGPVSKVEEYFAGLGINVPEHMNPTDHFIDVLEEIVKPITSLSINYRELPMRWMLHKGYPVPPDMQQDCAGLVMSSTGVNLDNQKSSVDAENKEQSLAGEIWKDMICTLELHWDIIQHNILRSRDLSNRRTPGVLMQYKYFLGRVGKQRLREARLIAVDLLILLLAGACVGSLTKTGDENFGVSGYIHTIIAVSLLCKIAALRTFSLDKLQYWRESASGICSLAHFLSKETIDHFNTVIKPVVYLSMFYSFSNPRSSFADNYIVLLCLVYCVTGIGYALSIFLGPGTAQLCAVLIPVVLALISIRTGENKFVKKLANLSYPRWALEAFVIANAERYSGVWLITRCGALMELGFNIHDWGHRISSLILLGIFCRLIAFFGMVAFLKK